MTMSSFDLLARPIRRLLEEIGFKEPTEPQEKAIPTILSGKNVLLIAPTGTGKTEAAVLPVLHMYLSKPRNDVGIKILYITPLRALNRDMLRRLLWWCQRLDVRVMVRHGDTEPRERAIQAKHPPDLLITTPETLQAILAGKTISQHLKHVRWIIVDEVHELADNKRGAQLSIALQRLKRITIEKPQIIGLSATVGSPEEVGKFLVGVDDEIEILEVPCVRYMKFKVKYPKPTREDDRLAAKLYTLPEVAARLRVIKEIVEKAKSCLIFVNTRSIAEVLASRFKVWNIDIPISIHHGSLAKPSRILTEKKLKSGELRGVVCTSSLELGIDIGHVDIVIQYMSPREVTRLVQRVGRSGHRIGRIAKGIVITMDPDDTLEAVVICRRAKSGLLEPVKIPDKPLDVLCHQIAGLLVKKNRWKFEDILEIVRKAYPYRNLSMEELERVIEYMHNRYPRLAWASFEDKVVLRPRNLQSLYRYYFEHLSMIPDEKQYLVIDDKTDTPLGILDEAFVAEYGEPGTKFIIRGSPWKIISIVGDRIYVTPVNDPTGAIPSWVGEEIPVPFEVAQEVGAIRREICEKLENGVNIDEVLSDLVKRYPISKDDLRRSVKEIVDQFEHGLPIPSDRIVTVESWDDYTIITTHAGTLVNRALARALALRLSENIGVTVTVQEDPYRVILKTLGLVSNDEIIEILKSIADEDPRKLSIEIANGSGLFKRRLIHVARRFGAIGKHADLTSVSLRSLISSYKGTVIYDEALNEFLQKDVDIGKMLEFLKSIKEGKRLVIALKGGVLTPIGRLGLERAARKTEIIKPERMYKILIEAAKARLKDEALTFFCMNCWEYVETIRIKDLPEKITCPICGSGNISALKEDEDTVRKFCRKKGQRLNKRERRMFRAARDLLELYQEYGKVAFIAYAGKNLRVYDVEDILWEVSTESDKFYEAIIKKEREALKRRFSW